MGGATFSASFSIGGNTIIAGSVLLDSGAGPCSLIDRRLADRLDPHSKFRYPSRATIQLGDTSQTRHTTDALQVHISLAESDIKVECLIFDGLIADVALSDKDITVWNLFDALRTSLRLRFTNSGVSTHEAHSTPTQLATAVTEVSPWATPGQDQLRMVKPFVCTTFAATNSCPTDSGLSLAYSDIEVDSQMDAYTPMTFPDPLAAPPFDVEPNINSNCSTAERSAVLALLQKYKDCFSETLSAQPAKVAPMHLELMPEANIPRSMRAPARIIAAAIQKEVDRQVATMLNTGIIESADDTDFHSQVIVVKKADGTFRLCVDYRNLNQITRGLHWPLPLIDHLLHSLGGRHLFSKLDLTQGFHQCELTPEASRLSAFRTPRGIYRFKRVPFGLKGAPSFFQRMIADVVLRGLIPEVCNVYIDDIIIASSSFDEQLHHMELVFHRLKKYNITVKLSKCVFASPTVQYLGHMISSRGVHITDERKEHIRNIRRPITVSELHSFLGLCNYFRDFISHFAEIAAPLYYHLKRKPKAVIPWTHEDTTAFEMIRDSVSSALPLAFLQESGQIILYTDASDQALGGHLVQIQRLPGSSVDQEVTIAFVSKKFTDVQRRWSTTDKECYAILFSIEKLRHMLGGRRFSVRTDHACLSHWINDSIHSLKIQRWKLKLSEFDFDVTHIAGLQNNVADVLSRLCAGTSAKVEPQDDIDDQSDKSIKELISRAHNDMVGHCGVRETIRRLKKDKISIPKLYKSVQQFVSSCSTCQRMNHTVKRYSAPHFTVIDGTPFAKIAIDTLGPLDDDPKFKYVVVFVDSMSRFVQFEPIPDLNGTTFLPILRNYICRWNPKAIQFDNHGQYNNHQVTQLLEEFNITSLTTTAYSHQENSLAELGC